MQPRSSFEWSSGQEIETTIATGGVRRCNNGNFDGLMFHLEPTNGSVGGLVVDGTYRDDYTHDFLGGHWFKIRLQLQGNADLYFEGADSAESILDSRLFVISHGDSVLKRQHFRRGSNERVLTLRFTCDDEGLLPPEVAPRSGRRQEVAQALTGHEILHDFALPSILFAQSEAIIRCINQTPADVTQSRLLALSESCLDHITRRLLGRSAEEEIGTVRARRIVDTALAIMEEDLAAAPSLHNLCRRVGVNRNMLNAAFRQIGGETAYAALRSKRMELARDLLTQSSLSIGEIARMVGYNRLANFSSAYRAVFGISPSREYERRRRVTAAKSIGQHDHLAS